MKKALTKSAFREIRSTFSRFLSIFGIVALGVGFFSGVKAAAPDMRNTVDNYLDSSDLADIRIVSTYGFDDDDVAAICGISGAEVYPTYFSDLIAHYADRPPAATRLMSFSDFMRNESANSITLTEGRMPENERECLVSSTKMMGGPKVGDTVYFTENNGDSPDDMLTVSEYTIVGTARSAMYIDKTTRGSTNIGSGSIESIYYIPDSNFCQEYYTEVYLRIPKLAELNCYSDEYKDSTDDLKKTAEQVGERRADERFDSIMRKADEKISDAEKKLSDAEKEYNEKIADGERKLADGEREIAENERKLLDGEAEIKENEQKLNDGEKEYSDGLDKYNDGLTKYNDGLAEYNDGVRQLEEGKAQYEEGKKLVDDGKRRAMEILGVSELTPAIIDMYAAISPDMKMLKDGIAALEDGERQIAEGEKMLSENKAKLDAGKKELDDAEQKLADARAELDDGWKQLNDGKAELEDGRKQLEEAKTELENGRRELEEKKAEGAEKIADARSELADAREKLNDLSKPKWYVFTRRDFPGFAEYGENADRINNIAGVFPVFFIIVAMLVCLTTMSRMVEEQRVAIGTLKALGYGNGSIIFKYMLYALSATVLGCVIGCAVGMYLFPFVIIKAYGMMYDLPVMCISIDFITAIIASAVFTAAIALTVYLTVRSALAEQAAQLMRPKAPKNGKRILLERVTPVWRRFGFSGKVTARNLFRYKRKMLMTVIGISGCTALLLTGLALFDSINDIIAKQFEDIQSYDGILAFDREKHPEAADETARIISDHNGDSIRVFQKLVTVKANGKSVNAYIAVPSDAARFTEFFDLRSRTTGEKYTLTGDTIYIDEKSSLLLNNIGAGDTMDIEISDTESVTVTLTAPFENYPNHYIYMTEEGYGSIFGKAPEYNVLYFRYEHDKDGEKEAQDQLGKELLAVDGALSVTFNADTMVTFTKMLETLSMVIIVIIASAGMLAFVVMYDLTIINITERIREIATLKVLGFYDIEVDSYVFRENILLAMLGTGAGLILGVFLAQFVITTAEVDIVMFGRNIYPMSFVLAAVITMVFSVMVTLAMHRRLQNVNMIEALKSVE